MTASIAGRMVSIEADKQSTSLSEASWLVMGCRGFETKDQAREFGEELRRAVHLAGLCTRVGVDAQDPGEDRTKSWVNPEVLGIGRGEKADMRLGPDVHGIVVLPDDDNTVFARLGQPTALQRPNAKHFIEALEDALPVSNAPQSGSASIRRAIRVLNLAEMNEDPIAQVVLAVSSIESLATYTPWTDEQRKLINCVAAWLEQIHGDGGEVTQVIEALGLMSKGSIRQRVKKLLAANDLSAVWQDWDKLYTRRSRLFHGWSEAGAENRGNHLEEIELHKLGRQAINLCAKIALSIAKREGVAIPGRAKVYFEIE